MASFPKVLEAQTNSIRILKDRNAELEERIRKLEAENERLTLDLEAAEEALEDAVEPKA